MTGPPLVSISDDPLVTERMDPPGSLSGPGNGNSQNPISEVGWQRPAHRPSSHHETYRQDIADSLSEFRLPETTTPKRQNGTFETVRPVSDKYFDSLTDSLRKFM